MNNSNIRNSVAISLEDFVSNSVEGSVSDSVWVSVAWFVHDSIVDYFQNKMTSK